MAYKIISITSIQSFYQKKARIINRHLEELPETTRDHAKFKLLYTTENKKIKEVNDLIEKEEIWATLSKSEIFSRETFTVVALSQREPTAVIGFCNFMVFDRQATLHKVLVKSADRKKGIGNALNYLGIQICRAEAIKINVLATSFYWELILPKTGIRTVQTMGFPLPF